MKKSALILAMIALFGFSFSAISCKEDNAKEKNKIEETLGEGKDQLDQGIDQAEEGVKDAVDETEDALEETKDTLESETDSEATEAMNDLNEAINNIKDAGNDFVNSIKQGDKAAEMEAAQTKFMESVINANSVYEEAIEKGVAYDDLNAAQQEITKISEQIQNEAQEAMNNR